MDITRHFRIASLTAGTALALATAGTPAAARELATVASNASWSVTPAGLDGTRRPYVEIAPAYGPRMKLPIVVLDGTRYTVAMVHTVGTHANPLDPRMPMLAPERRLVVGVDRRADYVPGAHQRDKVQLTLTDRKMPALQADVERGETRYVAFDILFDPTYELSPDSHYVIHFQGLQVGMGNAVMRGTGQPPFSIRVQGTTDDDPDPMAPIDLRFERRWWTGAEDRVQEAVLPGDGLDHLQRGRWYRIALRLDPGYRDGSIAVWHWDLASAYDRCDGPRQAWNAPWGYWPVPTGNPAADARRRILQYGVGIYRRATETRQLLQLRNIRYGTGYADVVPGRPC